MAAVGIQVRDSQRVRNIRHPQGKLARKTEEILIVPLLNHRHKSLKGSTILFSVVGNIRLLLTNKITKVQNSQRNKAGNNSIIQKHCTILQESEGGRGQVCSSRNRYRETAGLRLAWILGDYVLHLRQLIFQP